MRIGVVVDATCDLPAEFYQLKNLGLLPIRISTGNAVFADFRERAETERFYLEHADTDAARFESTPATVEEICEVFLNRLVVDYDFVFCITVASKRSPTYQNMTIAAQEILNRYRPHRNKAGIKTPFSMRVIDGQSFFSGTGALVAEVVRMIETGVGPQEIRLHIEQLAPKICIHMVPQSLSQLRARGFKKGERSHFFSDNLKSIGLAMGSALSLHPVIRIHAGHEGPAAILMTQDKAIERLFKHTIEQIRAGKLLSPQICMSYSGDISIIRQVPGYRELAEVSRQAGVELLLTVTSITGLVNCGPGCLILAYIGEPLPM
ncbi:MAG: DegV family protein [Stagnimonas sp.]|nr:DegV family protein [Stagnimonas sp.]